MAATEGIAASELASSVALQVSERVCVCVCFALWGGGRGPACLPAARSSCAVPSPAALADAAAGAGAAQQLSTALQASMCVP